MPERYPTPTSPWGLLALPTLVTWLGMQTLRVFFPTLVYVVGPRVGIAQAAVLGVNILAVGLLAPLSLRLFGVKGTLGLSAGGVIGLRLLEQWQTDGGNDLILSALGVLSLAAFFPALLAHQRARRLRPPGSLALGLLLGLALDTATRGATISLDLSWQPDVLLAPVTVGVVALLALAALWVELRAPHAVAVSDLPLPTALTMVGLGPLLALELMLWQNIGWLAQSPGWGGAWDFPTAWLAVGLGNVLALGLAARVVMAPHRALRLPTLGAGVALTALLATYGPGHAWAVVIAGHGLAGFLLARILTTLATGWGEAGTPARLGLAGAGALLAMFLLMGLFYGLYNLYLILPLCGALMGATAYGAARRHTPDDTPFAYAGALPVALAGVLLILPVLQSYTWQTPTAGPPLTGRTLRVLSYNVHQGFSTGGFLAIEEIARAIEASGADVVGLQEVHRGWALDGGLDMVTWLSQRLAMPYVFAPTIGDTFGNAVLSRVPLVASESQLMPPHPQSPFPRGYLRVVVDTAGGPVSIIVTHLDSDGDARAARLAQIEFLLQTFPAPTHSILMGDLNAEPQWPEIQRLRASGRWLDAFEQVGAGDGYTFSTDRPRKRIDYIWATPDLALSAFAMIESTASDHRGLAVTVRVR